MDCERWFSWGTPRLDLAGLPRPVRPISCANRFGVAHRGPGGPQEHYMMKRERFQMPNSVRLVLITSVETRHGSPRSEAERDRTSLRSCKPPPNLFHLLIAITAVQRFSRRSAHHST